MIKKFIHNSNEQCMLLIALVPEACSPSRLPFEHPFEQCPAKKVGNSPSLKIPDIRHILASNALICS